MNYVLPLATTSSIDTSQIYINAMENQPFPGFVGFTNATNTITYRPKNSTDYQGNTYYFSVVLKETHSDYIMNIYYITVKFTGTPYVTPVDDGDNSTIASNNTFTPANITFNISNVNW